MSSNTPLSYRNIPLESHFLISDTAGNLSFPFNLSAVENQIQLQIIQSEHGGGECDCWTIVADLILLTDGSMFDLG